MKVMGINTCSKYKKALKWFKDNKIEFETVDLREHPLTKSEMKKYHLLSGLPINKFFNTSGKVYRELDLKNKQKELSIDEIYDLLAKHPMLIKRPLIIDGDYVRTGFKEEEYIEKWL